MAASAGRREGSSRMACRLADAEGKVAIVTGVSSGIGAGIARAFVDRGAQVVGLARRKEQGEALRAEMKQPDNYTFVQTDISVVDDCARAAAAAVEAYGRIDILI